MAWPDFPGNPLIPATVLGRPGPWHRDGMVEHDGPGAGWVSTSGASARLSVSQSTMSRFRAEGLLDGVRDGHYWFVSEESLEALAQERGRWISQATTAVLFGGPLSAIAAAVARGELTPRPAHRALPSLPRSEVQEWVDERRRRAAERAAREQEHRELYQPPDDGQVWPGAETAAIMLGHTSVRVRRLAADDRLPHARKGRRLWFLREHIEIVSAARASEHAHAALQSGHRVPPFSGS